MRKRMTCAQNGFTVIEVTITLLVMMMMLASFGIATSTVLKGRQASFEKEQLTRDAALIMQRIVSSVNQSPLLILPLSENDDSSHLESLREQHVPAAAGQEKMTAVLAMTLSPEVDRDADGIADADNDGDGLFDEDPGADSNNDFAAGIFGIDDDHDGDIDEDTSSEFDDDEDGFLNEDALGGGDTDNDSSVDEDSSDDLNQDFRPGLADIDDDGDGNIDEGSAADDDEDGLENEDWYDTVVFYIKNDELYERQPFPRDLNGDGKVTGEDYIERVLADNVSYFRVERIDRHDTRAVLLKIRLELRNADGQIALIETQVRARGRS